MLIIIQAAPEIQPYILITFLLFTTHTPVITCCQFQLNWIPVESFSNMEYILMCRIYWSITEVFVLYILAKKAHHDSTIFSKTSRLQTSFL